MCSSTQESEYIKPIILTAIDSVWFKHFNSWQDFFQVDCLWMFQDQSTVRPIFESCVWWLSSKSSDGHLWYERGFTGKVSLCVVVVWILSKTKFLLWYYFPSLFEAWGMDSIIFYVVQRFHIQDLTGMLAVGFSPYSRGTLMIVSWLIWFGFHLC